MRSVGFSGSSCQADPIATIPPNGPFDAPGVPVSSSDTRDKESPNVQFPILVTRGCENR
jgi:hypothetical protein